MHHRPWLLSLLILITTIHDGCGVVNGQLGSRSQFPYSVALVLTKSKGICVFCSGAIISERHILTAAHCFYCIDRPSQIEAIISDSVITKTGVGVKVERFYRHPNFDQPDDNAIKFCYDYLMYCLDRPQDLKPKNDIAIATLMEPLSLEGNVDKVLLPPPQLSSYPKLCTFTGWGMANPTKDDGKPTLRWTQLAIREPAACHKMEIYVITNDVLCAEDLTWRRSYPFQGDSGGPLVCDNVVYGVYSGRPTDTNRPSFFFKVSNYLQFIKKIVQKI